MTNHVRHHPPQMRRTSDLIGRNLAIVEKGQNRGQFPALDRIFDQRPTPKTTIDPDTICGEGCERRHQNRIMDIYPSVPERLAKAEAKLDMTTESMAQMRQEYRNDDHNLELRVDDRVQNIHTRIDRDVLPAIRDVQKSNTFKLTLVTVGAVASLIYSVIMTYKNFHL